MPLAYYAQTATEEHWTDLWQKNRLDHLLTVAGRDPLSMYLQKHLGDARLVIEGGCGLGQHVIFFEQLGYRIVGGDFSLKALQGHKLSQPASPLVALDLLHMPFADDTFEGHISIGVIEHFVAGPGEILAEIYRTQSPGSVLLISVPWLNGYRRLNGWAIRRTQSKRRRAGAEFYQYAYSTAELKSVLEAAGFQVERFYPYSPAKGLREVPPLAFLFQRLTGAGPGNNSEQSTGAATPTTQLDFKAVIRPVTGLRRILYQAPILNTFAHMILAVAHKPR